MTVSPPALGSFDKAVEGCVGVFHTVRHPTASAAYSCRSVLYKDPAPVRITAMTSAPNVRAVGFYCPKLHQALGTRLYSPDVLAVESNSGGGVSVSYS